MVVLSASILTRNGKVLVARQFIEISRIRLEGLLNAFPKLLLSESQCQHTFIDTENVRYVYQPMENYVLLLITNKSSNLVEDLHTQHTLSKAVIEICGGPINEENVSLKQFEIIFAFDEIISPGGYAETTISLGEIKKNLEMESHEEKLYQMIQESKQSAAKDEMKRQQMRIRDEQKEKMRAGLAGTAGGAGTGSLSGIGMRGYPGMTNAQSPMTPSQPYQQPQQQSMLPTPSSTSNIGGSGIGGMKLGGITKTTNLMDAMVAEDNITKLPPSIIAGIPDTTATLASTSTMTGSSSSTIIPQVHVSNEPVATSIEEKLTVSLNREGAIQNLEIKGSLYVSANDQSIKPCGIRLSGVTTSGANGFTYQTHPKINKKLFETESTLALKDATKLFPEARVGVLRWGMKTTDESFLPLNITCWPEEETGGVYNVNIEYTLEKIEMTMDNVDVIIPLHGCEGNIPKIIDIDGTYTHNPHTQVLTWHIERISKENKNGTLEFTIHSNGNADSFFPLTVSFYSQQVYTDLHVDNVYALENGTPIAFGFDRLFTVDSYVIQ